MAIFYTRAPVIGRLIPIVRRCSPFHLSHQRRDSVPEIFRRPGL